MWKKISLIVVSLLFSSLELQAADLEEAKKQLLQWEEKLVSIRLKARQMTKAESNTPLAKSGGKKVETEEVWIWEKAGRFREQSMTRRDSVNHSCSLRIADDKHFYRIHYSDPNQKLDSPSHVTVTENHINVTTQSSNKTLLHGLWDGKTRTWLGERLQKVEQATENEEGLLEIDGALIGREYCVVRLDPEHGYLVQSIEHEGVSLYQVEEFQEIEPGFWFPKSGYDEWSMYGDHARDDWEIQEVELNTTLPDSLFVPPYNGSTKVNYDLPQPSRKKTPAKTINWTLRLSLFGAAFIAFLIWLQFSNRKITPISTFKEK